MKSSFKELYPRDLLTNKMRGVGLSAAIRIHINSTNIPVAMCIFYRKYPKLIQFLVEISNRVSKSRPSILEKRVCTFLYAIF